MELELVLLQFMRFLSSARKLGEEGFDLFNERLGVLGGHFEVDLVDANLGELGVGRLRLG
jgi:hypothetical protein